MLNVRVELELSLRLLYYLFICYSTISPRYFVNWLFLEFYLLVGLFNICLILLSVVKWNEYQDDFHFYSVKISERTIEITVSDRVLSLFQVFSPKSLVEFYETFTPKFGVFVWVIFYRNVEWPTNTTVWLVSFGTVAPDAVCYLIRGRRFTVSSSLSWFLCFGVIRALGSSSSRQKLRPQNLVCNFLEGDGLPSVLGGYTPTTIIKVLNKQPENRLCASDVKLYGVLQTCIFSTSNLLESVITTRNATGSKW